MLLICSLCSQNCLLNWSIHREDQVNNKMTDSFLPLRAMKQKFPINGFSCYLFWVYWSPLLLSVNPFEKDNGTDRWRKKTLTWWGKNFACGGISSFDIAWCRKTRKNIRCNSREDLEIVTPIVAFAIESLKRLISLLCSIIDFM